MPDHAKTSRSSSVIVPNQPIEVTTTPGTVRISAPELFSRGDEKIFPRLVERLLTVPEVATVDIDRIAGAVTVKYNRRGLPLSNVLAQLAAAIRNDRTSAPLWHPGEMDLRQIPGRVTRVERQRQAGRVVTTIVSVGTGILASYSKIVGRARGKAPDRNGTSADQVVRLDGLVVHFQPKSAVSAAAEPQLLIGDAQRLDIVAGGRGAADVDRGGVTHQVVVARGVRRLANLAAAGGCFVMSFVGLVTPGVPTVPFVLATSYFLVRSSPTLDDRLRRSRLFGQMVRDWEAYGGMRASTKIKFISLTLAIVVVTIVIADPSLPLLAVIAVMGTLGTALILQFRTVAEDAPDDLTAFAPA